MTTLLRAIAKLAPEQQRLNAIERLNIRRSDAVELEALYRSLVFKDQLPKRDDRAEDLFNLIGTTAGEGMYICNYLQAAMHLEGDICEFGVAQGATSRLLAGEIRQSNKTLWLFDSFEGLPEPSEHDVLIDDIFGLGTMKAYRGTMKSPRTEVEQQLAAVAFPENRRRIKPGWINETLAAGGDLPQRVIFSYVDFDFYEPIRDALVWLDPRTPVGGAALVDDYGFFSAGAKKAVDEFVEATDNRWERIMPVPAAGHFCVLVKHRD